MSNTCRRLVLAMLLLPLPSMAMELTFYGQRPALQENLPLRIEPGVEPGVRVAFDTSSPTATVLRPASNDEQSSVERPLYVFEWQRRGVGRFYPVTPQADIERLEREHDLTGGTPEGRTLESVIMTMFLYGGQVLRSCVQPGPRVPQQLTVYLTFTAGSTAPSELVVLPEGPIAECMVTTRPSQQTYPAVPVRFVAKGMISLVNNKPPAVQTKPEAGPAEGRKQQTRPR